MFFSTLFTATVHLQMQISPSIPGEGSSACVFVIVLLFGSGTASIAKGTRGKANQSIHFTFDVK